MSNCQGLENWWLNNCLDPLQRLIAIVVLPWDKVGHSGQDGTHNTKIEGHYKNDYKMSKKCELELDCLLTEIERAAHCIKPRSEAAFRVICEYIKCNTQTTAGSPMPDIKTLKRAWNYKSEKTSPSAATRNKLAESLKYDGWEAYKEAAQKRIHSDPLFNPEDIKVDKLKEGEIRTIGWYPNRYVKIKYLGNYQFEVVECKGMNKSKGEKIIAKRFGLQIMISFNNVYNYTTKQYEVQMGYPERLDVCAINNDNLSDEDLQKMGFIAF